MISNTVERDLENEKWKEFENTGVFVSDLGRIKRYIKHKLRYTLGWKTGNGYYRTAINNKEYFVHRLVAILFIPNEKNKPQIDHINTIRTDNRVENLRWVTQSENNLNPITSKRLSESLSKRSPIYIFTEEDRLKCIAATETSILQYSSSYSFIKEWKSIHEAERALGISSSNICNCCKGKRNKAGGYIWQYKG